MVNMEILTSNSTTSVYISLCNSKADGIQLLQFILVYVTVRQMEFNYFNLFKSM